MSDKFDGYYFPTWPQYVLYLCDPKPGKAPFDYGAVRYADKPEGREYLQEVKQ